MSAPDLQTEEERLEEELAEQARLAADDWSGGVAPGKAANFRQSFVRMIGLLKESSATTDEAIWQLPLERRYRTQLDSDIADISNLGGPYGGTITAALFLDHFTGGTPWAHLDIAGTMQTDSDDSWSTKGATGFGARLLLDVARRFTRP